MKKVIASFFTKKPTLIFCIAMDLIGMASYIFPGMGEWVDTVWAPISGFIFASSFGGAGGVIGGIINFIEEIIPFTDIIPTFTIAWYIQNKIMKTVASGFNKPNTEDAEVIEIK
ncbi:MAG: hypothetical protein KA198_03390 [Chitinophagaceae bacterium]|nr:hypothetical protein [Chitinophagaceae bacterium]